MDTSEREKLGENGREAASLGHRSPRASGARDNPPAVPPVVIQASERPGYVKLKGPGEPEWRKYLVTRAQADEVAEAFGVPLVEEDS